jgi:peptidoglycan-N-acetylglucosamine deacetylase
VAAQGGVKVLWWILGGAGLALLAADVLGRQLGLGALGGGDERGGNEHGGDEHGGDEHSAHVALTFDDGPSAQTGALLEVLARHGARATFFLTGTQAQRFPEAVKAMQSAGHQLESHGYTHRHALTFAPWQERRQLGWHPEPGRAGRLYRPPWGGHSPFTRLLAGRAGVKVALWTAESRDWTGQPGADLARGLLPGLKGGSVLLLHDGPDAARSARTLELLEVLLPALRKRDLDAVTLNQLGPRPIRMQEGWQRLLAMWRPRAQA